jgi:hypothetical protein
MAIELTQASGIELDNILYGHMTPQMAAAYLRQERISVRSFSQAHERRQKTPLSGADRTAALLQIWNYLSSRKYGRPSEAGGWFSRRLGILRALIVMLVIVLVCMLTGSKSLMVLLLGLFMINCTMPITLYLANYVLPEREGLAFGILAAALMPGYLLKS